MTHLYTATVHWQRGDQDFLDRRYRRGHDISFDSGVRFPGSPAPSIVKPPLSREDAVDPEELFVAALSSCHMLFFLELAAKAGFRIDDYRDDAEGVMAKNEDGEMYVSQVTLKPAIAWSGASRPTDAEIAALHHKAHVKCFIANSARSEIIVAPVPPRFA